MLTNGSASCCEESSGARGSWVETPEKLLRTISFRYRESALFKYSDTSIQDGNWQLKTIMCLRNLSGFHDILGDLV